MLGKTHITVVVTVYNKYKYLEKCFKSIISQTDQDFNFIIIDDGSDDKSPELCKELCTSYDKAEIVLNEHKGVSYSRNLALKMVTTDYILFIDGDDYIESDTIACLNKKINSSSPDLLIFGINHVSKGGSIINSMFYPDFFSSNKDEIRKNMVKFWDSDIMYSSCNKLFKTSHVRSNSISFPDCDFGEDMRFVCNYFNHIDSVMILDRCYYNYLQHNDNSLSKKNRSNFFELRKEENYFLADFFRKNGLDTSSDCKDYLSRRYVERLIGTIENEVSFKNRKNIKSKYSDLKKMISDGLTKEYINNSSLRSVKMKILAFPIKHELTFFCYFFALCISLIRNSFPMLFFYLKNRR